MNRSGALSLLVFFLGLVALTVFFLPAQGKTDAVPSCPTCTTNSNVIPVIYGKPGKALIDRADRGEVKLGGCNKLTENWYCKKCKSSF